MKSPKDPSVSGIIQAMGYIALDTDTCAGCNICEAVCALGHEGVISPKFARLRIIDYYLEGRRIEGSVCKQCPEPECLDACPTGALHIDKSTGARVISAEDCTGCKACINACSQYPNTLIFYDADRKICLKCDLCNGDPQCVKFCPQAALSFSRGDG